MWVKICGTTNLEDARVAVEAGADALGFIFAPSPRRISPKEAKKIIAELPKEVEKVGVFVNQKAEIILDTVQSAGLTGVQLHGDEDLGLIRELRRKQKDLRVYKTVPARKFVSSSGETIGFGTTKSAARVIDAILLDSGTRDQRGGTGRSFDWQESAWSVRRFGKSMPMIIAGGLTPLNVLRAIEEFHPWGVDVVSGVEKEPGKKDHEKVRTFVKAAKAAAQS